MSETASAPHRLRAVSLGDGAAGILGRGGVLTSLAVFDRSFYVDDPGGDIFCFLRGDMEPGPLHVLCAGWPDDLAARLASGRAFRRAGAEVRSDRLVIDLSGARAWRPEGYPPRDRERARTGMERLLAILPVVLPPESLLAAAILPERRDDGDNPLLHALRDEVGKGLAALAAWLAAPDREPGKDVFSLVGLGPGLTPSGDDIVAGTMLALHALDRRMDAEKLARAGDRVFISGTNRVSRAHLLAAARGGGAAVFHDCLAAILGGGEGLRPIAARLGRVGHSSGWDVLLGMLWVLRVEIW